jgi:hypothetical protein
MKLIDDSELEQIMYSPVCSYCKHFSTETEDNVCSVFPTGIPAEIWTGKNDHKKPFKGDRGIQFEPI